MAKKRFRYRARMLSLFVLLIAAFCLTVVASAAAHRFKKPSTGSRPADVTWHFNAKQAKWLPSGPPPACPANLLTRSPVDLTQATAVFYPGQYRGQAYDANGGFSFEDSAGAVKVYLPLNAKLARLSSYIENGDQQYSLFFIHPCGMAVKFDHLLKLTNKYQKIVERLRPSSTVNAGAVPVEPPVAAKAGELVATAVGLPSERSYSLDFGMYNLRQPNPISRNFKWELYHQVSKSTDWFGVCWLDMLPGSDSDKLAALLDSSFDPTAKSDYCQAPGGQTI